MLVSGTTAFQLTKRHAKQAVCAALKDHPALLMYHVTDEPFIKDFGWIADTVKRIHKDDPKHPAYVNIINCVGKNPRYWYNGSNSGTDSYPEFVKTFLDTVPVKMLSFDKALETPDGGAVVSVIENTGLEYLCVVNRDPERELTLKVDLAPGVRRVRTDGTTVDAALYTGEYWLEPGAMEIFVQGK